MRPASQRKTASIIYRARPSAARPARLIRALYDTGVGAALTETWTGPEVDGRDPSPNVAVEANPAGVVVIEVVLLTTTIEGAEGAETFPPAMLIDTTE